MADVRRSIGDVPINPRLRLELAARGIATRRPPLVDLVRGGVR